MRPPVLRLSLDELVVDSFAGGGGASTGIEAAIGRPVDIAINHSAAAIEMHRRNHPATKHYQEDVWRVDPRESCGGRPVGLAWFSPDCTHFSRAKGTQPVRKTIRGLAWVVIRWAEAVRPRVIMLENVEEFCFPGDTTVLTKRGIVPIADVRVGDEAWTHNARWKPVTAVATRKAATVRLKGYGNSIVETTPNHQFYAREYAPKITKSGKFGRHEPRLLEPHWVRADELADVDAASTYSANYSGFAWATPIELPRYWMRLPAAVGVDVEAPAFFYMLGRWVGDGWIRKRKDRQNLVRICEESGSKADLLEERLAETGLTWHRSRHTESVDVFDLSAEQSRRLLTWLTRHFGQYAHKKTIPAWLFGASDAQREAFIAGYVDADGHQQSEGRCAVVSVSRCLAVGVRLLLHSLGRLASISSIPARSAASVSGERQMQCRQAYTVSWRKGGEPDKAHLSELHAWGRVREVSPGRDCVDVFDITVADDHSFIADGQVVHNCTWGPVVDGRPDPTRAGKTFRAWSRKLRSLGYDVEFRTLVAADYGTPTTRRRLFMVARCDGQAIQWPEATHGRGTGRAWVPASEIIDWSLPAQSVYNRPRPLAAATMARVEEGIRRHVVEALRPMVRQTELGFEAPIITKHYGGVIGHPLDRPLGTVTGQDHHALTTAFLIKYYGTGSTQGVDGPLHTVTSKARFGLVQVYGEPYRIADATMRMLAPSELFAAQGFPRGYQMTGTKTQQISLAGNSVCPQVAEAIVRANVVENEQRRTA